MELNGQAAIVTGGASGLGAATAAALAKAGCKVTVVDLNAAAAAVAERVGGLTASCDVADAASAEAAFAQARAAHGPARVLVNCAGIGLAGRIVGRDGPMPLADFERVIRINLIGTFNMLRLAAAEMGALDPGADGERGLIETPMFNGLPQEVRDGLAASVPFPSRLGMPDEYAALVLHIAQNRFLNGETIRLDGALRMAPR